jgi:hypothetical protein
MIFSSRTYGQCIQSVVILPHGQKPPHSAKVIFNSTIIPWVILGTSSESYLSINGKSIRCKKFQRVKKQPKNESSKQNEK